MRDGEAKRNENRFVAMRAIFHTMTLPVRNHEQEPIQQATIYTFDIFKDYLLLTIL